MKITVVSAGLILSVKFITLPGLIAESDLGWGPCGCVKLFALKCKLFRKRPTLNCLNNRYPVLSYRCQHFSKSKGS